MSKIPYRAIPKSLENDPIWLSLSLKRRALFQFIVAKSVQEESHNFRGKQLTFGQFLWSFPRLTEAFNSTLHPEDHYSLMGCHKAIKFLVEKGFLKTEKWGKSVKSETLISVTHLDTYKLMKEHWCKANDIECKDSVKQNGVIGVKQKNEENVLLDMLKTNKNTEEKSSGVNIENIVNIEQCKANKNKQDLTLKTVFMKDNVQTMPFFAENVSDDVDASRRYKLSENQIKIFAWLKSQKIDSSENTLSYWSKNYSLKRLQEVLKAAVKAKPKKDGSKSIGALMNHFLTKDIPVENNSKTECEAFMEAFKERIPAMNWKIGSKFVTCEIRGVVKEVSLNLHPNAFVERLIALENQFTGN